MSPPESTLPPPSSFPLPSPDAVFEPAVQEEPLPVPSTEDQSYESEPEPEIVESDYHAAAFTPASAPVATPPAPGRVAQIWKRIGGGSLAISIAIHAAILLIGGWGVLNTVVPPKNIDFLPGGGTQKGAEASQALSHQVKQKQLNSVKKSLPKQRLVSTNMNSAITLPDSPPDLLDLPDMSSMIGGGKIGTGMSGTGMAGFGGGSGTGTGLGGMSGITFKPIMMFGKEMKEARRIAVVMDVSRSMTKYLPAVVKELDKIALQSVLVMHYGCGMRKEKGRVDDKLRKTSGEDFARFWQNWQGKADLKMPKEEREKLKYDPSQPMPLEGIYKRLAGRPGTYFIDFSGVAQTQDALMSNEVMEADIVYWFADFQDRVDEELMEQVRRKLRGRKQKLYMHASARGKFFEQVKDGLVVPLGGEVVEVEVPR